MRFTFRKGSEIPRNTHQMKSMKSKNKDLCFLHDTFRFFEIFEYTHIHIQVYIIPKIF